jgi:2-amino-4-hydroxy-6-hydroxymethyldihydropteridine diphosphokinase
LGDRAATLQAAIDRLKQTPGVKLLAVSRWHETLPAGGPAGQEAFLNGAALLETSLSPPELWRVFQEIEQAAARKREIAWGPRTLDVDLLLYDRLILDTPELTVPHPRMMFRRFVMEPAAEIAPALVHPLLGWRLDKIQAHLATARNYIALFAPPGYSHFTRELAARLHAAIPSSIRIADPAATDDLLPPVCTRAACSARLERQTRLLGRTRWGETSSNCDELLVSDFWIGQSAIEASAWLDSASSVQLMEAWEKTFCDTLCSKLVVCLFDGDSTPTKNSSLETPPLSLSTGSRPCGIPLNREQLNHWKEIVLGTLAKGLGGPWLMLDLADLARASTEVAAAALAMR